MSDSKEWVYVISNPAWKGWVKIGMAVDVNKRLLNYQTCSPFRDYKVEFVVPVTDVKVAESTAHERASWIAEDEKNEWFKMPLDGAIEVVRSIKNEISS